MPLINDGTNWVRTIANATPAPIFPLFTVGFPIGMGSSCTIGANGDLSAMTAFQFTYSTGIYLYFSANAFYAGSPAGFYWCVMSSATAGTAYGNMLDITNPTAVPVANRIAIVGAGSAYTQSTAGIVCLQRTIPAGAFGLTSALTAKSIITNNSSAGQKTHRVRLAAGSDMGFWQQSTNTLLQGEACAFARGVTNAQFVTKGGTGFTGGIAAVSASQQFTADMSIDQLHTATLQIATATDNLVLESIFSEIKSTL
jgi:hypothetical protein